MENSDQKRNTHKKDEHIIQGSDFLIAILESLTYPFYVIDANDYSIKLANSATWSGSQPVATTCYATTCYALTHNRDTPCEEKEDHPCVLNKIKETKQPVITEHTHFDKDRKPVIYEVHGYPIFDSKGDVAQIVEYNLDITTRKRAEDQIKASLKEKDVLLREVYHRIKNNMSVISSLLNLQSQYIKDEHYKEMFKESVDRLRLMSLIHDNLYRSEDLSKINFSYYIKDMVDNMYKSYGLSPDKIKLTKDIERITTLGVEEAIPCALIINELVSNSLKHAFPEGRAGEIKVSLSTNDEDEIEITIADNGVGIPMDMDFRNTDSLGLKVVNDLVGQLQGNIELNREQETEFKISFRMNN
jgi:two-component sensor histidine kinase